MVADELKEILDKISEKKHTYICDLLHSQKNTFLLINLLERKLKIDINISGISNFSFEEILNVINQNINSKDNNLIFNKNCYIESLYEICKALLIDADFIFLSDWIFNYIHIDNHIYNNINYLSAIDDYSEEFGLKLNKEVDNNFFDFIFKQVNDEKLCLARIDAFYCPWNKAYNKEHTYHFLVIFDINVDEKYFLCKDPFVSKNRFYKIPYRLINDMITNVFCYERVEVNKKLNERSMLECLVSKKNLTVIINKSFCSFINDLQSITDIEELFNSDFEELNILCMKISQIFITRHNIASILVKYNSDNFKKLIELYENSYFHWKKVNFILLKLLILKVDLNKTMNIICEELQIIYQIESNIYKEALKQMGKYK